MELKKPVSGKILQHSFGMGVPTEETVERRAEEIALIEARTDVTEGDRQRAWMELHGGRHGALPNDEEMMMSSYSPQDNVSPSLGTQSTNLLFGQTHLGEELVAEGLAEAEHDQMLASRIELDLPEEEESEES